MLDGPGTGTGALGRLVAGTLARAARDFREAVRAHDVVNPPPPQRATTVRLHPLDPAPFALDDGWCPGEVHRYTSTDPFQDHNPELTAAAADLLDVIVDVCRTLRGTDDPALTYLDARRAGREPTVVTRALMDVDPGIGDWVRSIPRAESLRPVSHPWTDEEGTLLVGERGEVVAKPSTRALAALSGGAAEGRAVREREAWERAVLAAAVDGEATAGRRLCITSLGTGTGEPAMDMALSVMASRSSGAFEVVVNGFDLDGDSLRIAVHLAGRKRAGLADGQRLVFHDRRINLLDAGVLAAALATTRPQVVEAIGFAECVPSDEPRTAVERGQRERALRRGLVSAEGFHRTIYRGLTAGSVLLTGNMRDDSPQALYVTDGLGWKGIIQRSTEEYLAILRRAGIPGPAVTLYVPDPAGSSGVYNLVAVRRSAEQLVAAPQLGAARHAELEVDAAEVAVDGPHRDEQALGYGRAGGALGGVAGDLALAGGEHRRGPGPVEEPVVGAGTAVQQPPRP
jgi:hypothetical protein